LLDDGVTSQVCTPTRRVKLSRPRHCFDCQACQQLARRCQGQIGDGVTQQAALGLKSGDRLEQLVLRINVGGPRRAAAAVMAGAAEADTRRQKSR